MTQLFWFLITQSMKKKMVVEASTVVSEILFEHQNIWIDIQLKLRASIPNILFSDNSIPKYGIFENINSVKQLAQMPQWTAEKPLRVATGFTYLGPKFLKENGLQHITFSTTDGALEAAPAMGITDAIVDLVSSGTTLKENNLKEIEGGVPLESQNSLKDIAYDSTSTPGDKNDFANDDYSKVKGPEKRGYVRLIGKIPTTKINDETNEIEQLKSVIHVMANVIQEHMPNANLSTFFKNMNVQVPRNISSNE